MKAAIYSPYLDTLGGGERYVLSFAKVLADSGWDVNVESRDPEILPKVKERLGIDLPGIKIVESVKRGDGYDLCFWLSDGSVPLLFARRNILHFQRPFYKVDGKSLVNRMKFMRINEVIVNSEFTKKWIDKEYPCVSRVIYPPVDVVRFKPGKKEKLILYVGRFSQLTQLKRQDVLLDAFKKFHDRFGLDWKLVLAGGSDVGRTGFVDRLIRSAKTYPVKIMENPTFKEIRDLYGRASIFWSAAGFGINEAKEPEKVEHFGMTVVEGMAAGCAPFVFDAGGHREIIINGENGFLWKSEGELIKKTQGLIAEPTRYRKLTQNGKKSAQKFSLERFKNEVAAIL